MRKTKRRRQFRAVARSRYSLSSSFPSLTSGKARPPCALPPRGARLRRREPPLRTGDEDSAGSQLRLYWFSLCARRVGTKQPPFFLLSCPSQPLCSLHSVRRSPPSHESVRRGVCMLSELRSYCGFLCYGGAKKTSRKKQTSLFAKVPLPLNLPCACSSRGARLRGLETQSTRALRRSESQFYAFSLRALKSGHGKRTPFFCFTCPLLSLTQPSPPPPRECFLTLSIDRPTSPPPPP